MSAEEKDAARVAGDRLARRAAQAGVGVALTLIAIKLYAYLATDAVAMLSSLVDSSLDALASLANLAAVRHAQRPADDDHKFGHGKAEALAGLAQTAFIGGSAVFLLVEVTHRAFAPQPVESGWVGVAVSLISIVFTGALVLFQRYAVKRSGSIAVAADTLHYSGDLFLNLGVIAALVLTQWTGWLYFDPMFGAGVALLILHSAQAIFRDSWNMLMDRELSPDAAQQVREICKSHPDVIGVHDIRTRSAGRHAFIQLHLVLPSDMALVDAHAVSDEVERRIMAAFPEAEVLIHEDPASVVETHATREASA